MHEHEHQSTGEAGDSEESPADASSRGSRREQSAAYCPRCETSRTIALFGTTCLACGEELASSPE